MQTKLSGTFLANMIAKRRKLINALNANKGEVNLDIFEDSYPDRAHFVYEFLQNAEDAGTTAVTFTLTQNRLVCEHDGNRTFTEADVAAITGIHNSTKEKTQDRIGKFGVGSSPCLSIRSHRPLRRSLRRDIDTRRTLAFIRRSQVGPCISL